MRRSLHILTAVLMFVFVNTAAVEAASVQYTVKSGDNLWNIANSYHTSVDSIKSANKLQSDSLHIGDTLLIPAANTNIKTSSTVSNISSAGYSSNGSQGVYYVQAGDSLWRIATLHGMSVDELKSLNNNCSENLSIGQKLTVKGQAVNQKQVSRSASSIGKGNTVIERAAQFLGTPYAYGGTGPGGFDCSGFVRYVYADFGYDLPHNAAAQSGLGQAVGREELQPGDLVFFSCGGGGINHVGIYCGNERFIHSSSPRSGGVIYSSLTDSYWGGYYISASRIIN